MKNPIKTIYDKVKNSYYDYQESKRIAAEEAREQIRLNTPIIQATSLYKSNVRIDDVSLLYSGYEGGYEEVSLKLHTGIYPKRFELDIYESIEVYGHEIDSDNEYNVPYTDWNHSTYVRTDVGSHNYTMFYRNDERLMTAKEEELVMRGIEDLEDKNSITNIIDNLEPYFIFSFRVTALLNSSLKNYCQSQYKYYKKYYSDEDAKQKALNDVKPYKHKLNECEEKYENLYRKQQREKDELSDLFNKL